MFFGPIARPKSFSLVPSDGYLRYLLLIVIVQDRTQQLPIIPVLSLAAITTYQRLYPLIPICGPTMTMSLSSISSSIAIITNALH